MEIQLPIQSYQHRSRSASSTRLVNCFAESMPPGSRSPVLLTRAPGQKSWSTVGSGPIQGLYAATIDFASGRLNRLYVVSDRQLYSVDANKSATLIGEVGTPVRIDFAHNTDSLVVVNQPNAFYYDGTTYGEINDPEFTSRGAGDVEFLENFLLFREPDSNRFFGANIGSAQDFTALQFANSDTNPDQMIGMLVDYRSLLCFNEETVEIFENTGRSGFPFERNINGTMQVGLLSPNLVGRTFDVVYFVGDDRTVRRVDGNQPVRISTHYIEQRLERWTTSEGVAFAYREDGHFFIGFSFPEGTLVYDASTQLWHERASYNLPYWRPRFMVEFDGKTLAGDPLSNRIVEIDLDTYEDALPDPDMSQNVQRMEWTYQTIYAEGRYAFHNSLEVEFNAGKGLTTGQGSDPMMTLEYSDDSGVTWKKGPRRSMGKIGEYKRQVEWHNLGASRERVYRLSVSDPIPVEITNTIADVEGGYV